MLPPSSAFSPLTVLLCLSLASAGGNVSAAAASAALPYVTIAAQPAREQTGYDAVLEAVRQTSIAAQVSGAIVALDAKAGEAVKAGQVIARIDARAAEQTTAASDAQVRAAHAALEVASRDVERQRLLFQKRYISEAALERAEAQFKSTQAQVDAQLAQAGAARTQSGFFTVRAPYAGIIADVPVTLGDMAMPGRPIAILYDPTEMRASATIPQTAVPTALAATDVRIEIAAVPSDHAARVVPTRVTVLPTVDPASHTLTVRFALPPMADYKPGMFARAWIPATVEQSGPRVSVPTSAIVQRAELTAVYVLDGENRPLLRQVRLGRSTGGTVHVLAGLSPGDRVVTQPQMAARLSGTRNRPSAP